MLCKCMYGIQYRSVEFMHDYYDIVDQFSLSDVLLLYARVFALCYQLLSKYNTDAQKTSISVRDIRQGEDWNREA